jgi:hypothetical protein
VAKKTAFDLEFSFISATAQLDVIPEFSAVRGILTQNTLYFFPKLLTFSKSVDAMQSLFQ